MKAKLKGQGGIKGLALLHGEKILIGLVGLVALYFVYASLSLPKLESKYQASNLQGMITETNTKIQNTKWPEAGSPEAEQVRFTRPIEQNANLKVPDSLLASNPASLNPPVIQPTILRTDPRLLGAVDVRAIGGSGLFGFKDKDKLEQFQVEERRRQEELDLKQKKASEEMQPDQDQRGGKRKRDRDREARGGPEGGPENDPDYDSTKPNRRRIQGQLVSAGAQITGGERIERHNWATVVAKVPVREQEKLYAEAFENAKGGYDPGRDMPNYFGYIVQRAEVVPGKPLTWKEVGVYDGQDKSLAGQPISSSMRVDFMGKLREAALMYWAPSGTISEPVDSRYLDYLLTFPMPPLVGRNWGADATHPDIPLASNAPQEEMIEEMTPETQTPAQPVPAEGEGDFSAGFTNQAPGAMPGAMPVGPEGMATGGPISPEFGRGGPEGGMDMSSYGMTGSGSPLARGVDFKLFRFVDFTVQPGKKYKYRVKLVLYDPNFNVDKNFLSAEVLDRKPKVFRMVEDWSEPSPTVGIPLAGSVRLAQVKPKTEKPNDEPTASLLLEAFDVDEQGVPIQAATEPEGIVFRRGAVANLTHDADFVEANGQFVDKKPGFNFQTGMTVLDIVGGEKLPNTRDMTVPARILLMGPAGELYIRNEVDDKPAVEYHRQIFNPEPESGGAGSPEFGPEGGGRGSMRARGPT